MWKLGSACCIVVLQQNVVLSAQAKQATCLGFFLQIEGDEGSSKGLEGGKGQQEEAPEQIKQKQPDLATVAEDDSDPEDTPPQPPLQRAPSPSASHSSADAISPSKKNAGPKHPSAFGHADVQAQRTFSGRTSDSGDLGKKPSASLGYSGLNPTGTRSASRMMSDNPPAATKKPSGPVTKRDLANSILQMDMDHELDTFTADIDCLADSSDEEEEQPAARGRKKAGGEEEAGAEPVEKQAEGAGQKKSKRGKDDDDESEDGVSLLSKTVLGYQK